MSRAKIAEPVDTTVIIRPWIGKRVATWWRTNTVVPILLGLIFCVCAALAIWAVLDPPAPVTTDAVRAQQQVGQTQQPASATDLLPAPVAACPAQDPVAEILPEQLVGQTYTTQWYPVGTMSAPRSPTGGPAVARQCFSRTPEGALYAISTQLAEILASEGATGFHFSGYQWRSFTGDKAVLLLRVRADTDVQTQYLARMFVATWTGTDWQADPDMSAEAVKSAEDPLRVFTPWGDF